MGFADFRPESDSVERSLPDELMKMMDRLVRDPPSDRPASTLRTLCEIAQIPSRKSMWSLRWSELRWPAESSSGWNYVQISLHSSDLPLSGLWRYFHTGRYLWTLCSNAAAYSFPPALVGCCSSNCIRVGFLCKLERAGRNTNLYFL